MSTSALGPPLNQYAVLVPIDISDIAFTLGYMLNFGLLGVLSIQLVIYATRFRRDPKILQFAVFLVFFLEVFNSTLVVYSAIIGANIRCLSCLITGKRTYILNGVLISKALNTWAFQALCVLTGISSSIVQAFFAWRIWILGKCVWIPLMVIATSLAQCITLSTGGILSASDSNLGVFDSDGAVIWLIISAACDILITVRTAQLLFRSRDGQDCPATQSLVRKLVKMTIETGLVTVIATFLEFAIARTLNIAHHGVFYFLSKLYANCLLATLNARLVIKNTIQQDPNTMVLTGPVIFQPGEIQLSPVDAGSFVFARGLHKVQPAPAPAPRDSTSIMTSYHSVGVQNNVHTDMVARVRSEQTWDSIETDSVSGSESSEVIQIVRPRSFSSPLKGTFVESLESESEIESVWAKSTVEALCG